MEKIRYKFLKMFYWSNAPQKKVFNGGKVKKLRIIEEELIGPQQSHISGLWQELKVWHVSVTLNFVKDTNETVEKTQKKWNLGFFDSLHDKIKKAEHLCSASY